MQDTIWFKSNTKKYGKRRLYDYKNSTSIKDEILRSYESIMKRTHNHHRHQGVLSMVIVKKKKKRNATKNHKTNWQLKLNLENNETAGFG